MHSMNRIFLIIALCFQHELLQDVIVARYDTAVGSQDAVYPEDGTPALWSTRRMNRNLESAFCALPGNRT
jgi:hypothetical protein